MIALTGLATAVGPHLFWLASRAAGSAALVLASLSVCVGLSMGGRLVKKRSSEMRVLHEALSLATLAALVVHGLSLLGDSYLRPSILDVSVPFVSSYKTFWTASGIIAFWALAALGLAYYARARIGVARWRALHRFTALAWLLGLVHALGEGSDAGQLWFLAMTAVVVMPALTLLLVRVFASSAPSRSAPASSRSAPASSRSGSASSRSGSAASRSGSATSRVGSAASRTPARAPSAQSQAATT